MITIDHLQHKLNFYNISIEYGNDIEGLEIHLDFTDNNLEDRCLYLEEIKDFINILF